MSEAKGIQKSVLSQREAMHLLGVSRYRFTALEQAKYFQRLRDSQGGVAYLRTDIERFRATGETKPASRSE